VDGRVWRLAGPQALIREVVAEQPRGRHVAVVLPAALAADQPFTDSLAVSLLEEFSRRSVTTRRVYNTGEPGSVLKTFCQALIFDNEPVTIPDLLGHPEVTDTVAVVVATDLCSPEQRELAQFLQRVELESHAGETARRFSIVAVVSRSQMPDFAGGASSDVAMTSIWWWGRVARWDVATYIAGLPGPGDLDGVLAEVRAETVVEVARWDLDLAEELTSSWSGEPADLPSLLKDWRRVPDLQLRDPGLVSETVRPPDQLLAHWDERAVERWHHHHCVSGCSLVTDPGKLDRVVWAAQARVLLPWIEERRAAQQAQVIGFLGPQRWESVLQDCFQHPMSASSPLEIGALDRVVRMTIGSRDVKLKDAIRRLRDARNCLAHMRPLSLGEQSSLVAACRTASSVA
jgi:hypothetical protein